MARKKKKSTLGGHRTGAGRKTTVHKEGRTRLLSVSVPEVLVDKLDLWRAGRDLNRSAAATAAIRKLVSRGR